MPDYPELCSQGSDGNVAASHKAGYPARKEVGQIHETFGYLEVPLVWCAKILKHPLVSYDWASDFCWSSFFVAGNEEIMDTLDKLYELDDEELFTRAREAAEKHARSFWSPVPINTGCTTTPPCRHCKWESFKASRPAFGAKRSIDDILRSAERALNAGATHFLVPSGWMGYEVPDYFCDCFRAIKSRFDLEAYGLFGSISLSSLIKLKEAGMGGYQCGLESPDEAVFRRFRPGGDSLKDRKETLSNAKKIELLVSSGFLLAFGLTDKSALDALRYLKSAEADWVAVQPFVPYPYTTMKAENPTNPYRWARIMAIARLYLPENVNLIATENTGCYENFLPLTGANSFFVFPHIEK